MSSSSSSSAAAAAGGGAAGGAAGDEEFVILLSEENAEHRVSKKVAQQSTLVATMTADDSEDNSRVPLTTIKSSVLGKVIEFMNHHVDKKLPEIEKPLKSANLSELTPALDPWDIEFVSCDQEMLFELILAANFMDIKPLLDLACAKVASMIKGKTPEDIRKTFNIKNDFTPEEESAIKEENKWVEEV